MQRSGATGDPVGHGQARNRGATGVTSYAELRIRIDRGVGRGSYRVVAAGPSGEALGRFKLPFSDLELENFILRVGATRRGRRRVESPEMELAKTFGAKLFGAVFEGDVRELYRSSIAETRADGAGLRVSLSLTGAPELLQVPWEYLYDHPSFLSISTWTPIVRYLDLPKPRRPLQVELPLRILAMVSAPSDAERIDGPQERAKLEEALKPLIDIGAIAIDWLEEASLRALQRQLRKADYHVFHYIGHGGYDQNVDDGILLFEDEAGRGRRTSGIQLGTILADEVSLRLAVLNSCEGARSSIQDPFSGVATSLIEREIPAVIGMQFEITDRAAIVFAGEFYSALADGLAVDSSVAEARKAIYADENDIEWGTPVLFMRVADGRLFEVAAHAPIRAGAATRADAPVAAAMVTAAGPATAPDAEPDRASDAEATTAAAAGPTTAADAEPETASDVGTPPSAPTEPDEHDGVAPGDEPDEADRMGPGDEPEPIVAASDRPARDGPGREEAVRAAANESEPALDALTSKPWVSEDDLFAPVATDAPAVPVSGTVSEAVHEPSPIPATTAEPDPGVSSAPIGQGTALPIDLGRVAGRAAIAAIFAALVTMLWILLFAGDTLEHVTSTSVGYLAATITAMVAGLVLAEGLWPSVRVPAGRLYLSVGGDRRAAASIQGAIMGATVGAVVTMLVWDKFDLSIVIFEAIVTAVGFLIAVILLDRWDARKSAERTGK